MGEKVKAKFTAYYPSNEGVEGGYYDCQGVLLSTYLNNGTNVVAAPKECAINSKIKISGTGTSRDGGVYLVRDRGGAINVNSDGTYCFDILTANKKEANAWGVRYGYAELDVEGSTSGSTSTVTTKYWVGDSRFDAIKSMASSNDTFICKVGAGYSWFTNTAVPKLKSELKNASGEVVILAMGVNDLHNKSNYVSAYKSLMSSYSNVKFLVVSVNPVCDSKSEYAKNSDIEAFNSTLQSNFPNNYIDVYSKIKDQVNDSSTDSEGVHYNDTLNKIVFDTISDAAGGTGTSDSGTTSSDGSSVSTAVARPIIITKKYEYYSGQKNSNVISFTFEFQGICVEDVRVNSSYSVDTVKNEMIQCSSSSKNIDKVAGKIMGMSSSSAKSLKAKSQSMWSLYSKVQYGATLEILGDPTVKVGSYCYVAVYTKYGYLHHTSGIYYIKSADDSISGGTFTTTLTLLKVGSSTSNAEAYVDGLDSSTSSSTS